MRSKRAQVLLLLVAHLTSACVITAPPGSRDLGPPPSEATRARMQKLGVRLQTTRAIGLFEAPTAGKLRGMYKGFGLGLEAWAESGQSIQSGGTLYLLVLPVFMLGGGITGLIRAPSRAAVARAEENLIAALGSHDLQTEFLPHFLTALREQTVEFVVLEPEGERPAELDGVLQIGIESVSLYGQGLDPHIPLRVRCRARLFGAPGESLHDLALDFAWNKDDFTGWGSDEGGRLHTEVALSYAFLATAVVDELFLVYLPPLPLPPETGEAEVQE